AGCGGARAPRRACGEARGGRRCYRAAGLAWHGESGARRAAAHHGDAAADRAASRRAGGGLIVTAAEALAADPQLTERVVLLIDLSSLFWSAWHSSGEDEISAARRRTLEAVQRCIGDQHHRLVAICCDTGRSFRKDLHPEYKANRPEK